MRLYLTARRCQNAQILKWCQNFAIFFLLVKQRAFPKIHQWCSRAYFNDPFFVCYPGRLFLSQYEFIRFANSPICAENRPPAANETQMSFLEGRHIKPQCGERGKVWLMGGWEWLDSNNAYLVAKPSSYTVATSSRVLQTAIYRNFPALRPVRKKTLHWKLDITHYNTYFTLETNYGLDLYFQIGLRWRSLMD